MCKKSYVLLSRRKRRYRLYSGDIGAVHKAAIRKRPPVPKYEANTDDGKLSQSENIVTIS